MSSDKLISPNITLDSPADEVRTDLPDRVLRPKEQQEFLGISPSQFYELQKSDSDFPEAIQLGGRARGRLLSDMLAYVNKKKRKTRSPNESYHARDPRQGEQASTMQNDHRVVARSGCRDPQEFLRRRNLQRREGKS